MKKEGKRGQFYLVAAIIIISIIVGFAVVSNYARAKPRVAVYDLGKELEIEGGHVLEYGVVQEVNMQELMENFTDLFVAYTEEGKNIYFVYGNQEEITVVSYESVEEGSWDVGDFKKIIKGRGKKEETSALAEITVGEVTYPFELNPGENFYFVIIEEFEEEIYVA